MRERISSIISWILVVDLGLVLLSFGWFLAAVVGSEHECQSGPGTLVLPLESVNSTRH